MTDDQDDFRHSLRRFLTKVSPESEVRRLMTDPVGFDPATWHRMADELGLPGVAIPEAYGGQGFGGAESRLVFEELGRVLYGGPYFATVALGAELVLRLGDERARAGWLPRIADGSLRTAVALRGDLRGRAGADGAWVVDGTAPHVVDAGAASLLLVVAGTADGVDVLAVDPAEAGVTVQPSPVLDPTRRQAVVRFDNVRARRLGRPGQSAAVVARVRDQALVALAAEQAGGAARALELTVEHALTREQFGRPVGGFQAVKHLCAERLLDVESMRSLVLAVDDTLDDDAFAVQARTVRAFCSAAYFRVTATAVQVHGGIGFTWEHPIGLYFKRAKSSELLFDGPATQREDLADLLLAAR
ncbi:acyl-CoA dehydrogenase family protein [Micromonospora sp. WMMD998]|uniref:acyl-CoA dehydrogenase family protein n=1 Tax=Micromonospora sp. WMMD998 TaxID=3016092 RepID=UPI00249AED45|nr:acyl-CoA dehydrogenase family protein [Micromonospora sp. WMMD998]WFE40953.1 acyl-CoA/acyl-ACP dehydrogenase [Micromonospora sp. WMMD998]